MIAVDTNVVVRLLVGDDPEQARRARLLFEQAPIWIGVKVLLESEWVLRSAYNFSTAAPPFPQDHRRTGAVANVVGIRVTRSPEA